MQRALQPPLTPAASELRPYFRSVYRDPSVDTLPDEQLASRWARLTWVYHTLVASMALAFAQDYHHAHSSVCEAPAPTSSAHQPGLIFCPTIKVRNLHWFGFWRPATTLLHGCTETADPIVGHSLDEARPEAPFVEDNGWIEVTRIATRIMTGTAKFIRRFGEGGGHGCWFLGAVGSGVFMHVGRSLRVHNRTELMQRLGLPPPRGGSLYVRRRPRVFAFVSAPVDTPTLSLFLSYPSLAVQRDARGDLHGGAAARLRDAAAI